MTSDFGNTLKISIFGASHAEEIGVDISGLPKGTKFDEEKLYAFMDRRRPGKNSLSTPRNEKDIPIFTKGAENGTLTGEPVRAVIKNTNVRSKDYANLKTVPRPGHADFTAYEKYGKDIDMRGGGHFSARLTAPLCIAGGICLQMLEEKNIRISAHVEAIQNIHDERYPLFPDKSLMDEIAKKEIPVINDTVAKDMAAVIENARKNQDSVGGVVECVITGLPSGLGGAMFDGLESKISSAIFGIPAVKGIEFGAGFESTKMTGAQNNDAFCVQDGIVRTETNNCGGILGGISDGMPLVFRVAFKPTPSISRPQRSVDLDTMEPTELVIEGRHDPCVVIRAVPVVEATAALTIVDLLLSEGKL